MKRIQIILSHNGIDYVSKVSDLEENEYNGIIDMIKEACSDKLNYFSYEGHSHDTYYFGSEILRNSIITVIEIK